MILSTLCAFFCRACYGIHDPIHFFVMYLIGGGKRRLVWCRTALLFSLIIFLVASCNKKTDTNIQPEHTPMRILSFAPSITETLFALGLGDRVVGVTNFCTYPSEVKSLPKIGGYLDPNFEMVLRLRPDLVILLKEHVSLVDFLRTNSIQYLCINNENVAGVLQSFILIGTICKAETRADSLVKLVNSEMTTDSSTSKKPTMLICVGRDSPGTKSVTKVYAAGYKTMYQELITAAGARNVLADSALSYPTLSTESILRLRPDIIVDLMASVTQQNPELLKEDWATVFALRKEPPPYIVCLSNDYVSIPGPRIVNILHDFKTIVAQYPSH